MQMGHPTLSNREYIMGAINEDDDTVEIVPNNFRHMRRDHKVEGGGSPNQMDIARHVSSTEFVVTTTNTATGHRSESMAATHDDMRQS